MKPDAIPFGVGVACILASVVVLDFPLVFDRLLGVGRKDSVWVGVGLFLIGLCMSSFGRTQGK